LLCELVLDEVRGKRKKRFWGGEKGGGEGRTAIQSNASHLRLTGRREGSQKKKKKKKTEED